ncbi:MAG: glycerate kinase [Microbacterium sp.]|uniref:glycerate kinase n=1 Tax=Microbacterium sp. TaxID=51671 RepID=UPI003A88E871
MRVVFAPDSFKGSAAAAAVARALAAGWASERPGDDLVARPMADGGEGTMAAFESAIAGGRRMPVEVHGPDGEPRDAAWLLLPDGTGVVELASTSGIELLGDRRLPWDADTRGFGEAIAAALDAGVQRLVLGIGSSASTDGGAGLLTALGARAMDASGHPVARGARGLDAVHAVDLGCVRPPPPGGVQVLTDVTSPLLGQTGAAAVFGPQKGIDDVPRAEAALARWAGVVAVDPAVPGAGAAGGAGFGLLAWGARLVPGAATVAALVGLPAAAGVASLLVTGEGSYDGQSAAGKAPAQVAAIAGAHGVPVALVAGRVDAGADTSGFAASLSLVELAGSPEAALREPERWLHAAGARLARLAEDARR